MKETRPLQVSDLYPNRAGFHILDADWDNATAKEQAVCRHIAEQVIHLCLEESDEELVAALAAAGGEIAPDWTAEELRDLCSREQARWLEGVQEARHPVPNNLIHVNFHDS